jgi:tetratricopeptide (TPR) repeat protein
VADGLRASAAWFRTASSKARAGPSSRRGRGAPLRAVALALGLAGGCAWPGVAPAAASESGSAAGNYLAGRFALEHGDLDDAAAGLGRALELVPDDTALRRRVFVLEVASGDVAAALPHARTLIGAGGGDAAEAALALAVERVRREGPGAAHDAFAALPDGTLAGLLRPILVAWTMVDPGAGAAHLDAAPTRLGDLEGFHRVSLLDAADRPEEALAALSELADEPAGMSERLRVTQARLLARLGEVDAARAMLRLGTDGLERAALVRRADAALAAGEIPAALIGDPTTGIADALSGMGEVLRARGRPLNAIFYTRLGLHAAPDYDPGWLALGRLLVEQEGPAAGLAAFERVAEGSPWYRTARIEMAQAMADGGDLDAGAEVLRKLAAAEPEDARPLVALGDMLRRAERWDAAVVAYDDALARIDGDGGGAPGSWRLHYAHGIALERSSRWSRAERALQRALELEPEQPFVLNYLGYSWVDQGLNLDQAKAMLHRAVELRPEDGFIVDSLGWAYYRLEQYEKAVTHLERAVALEPGDPVINDHLGDAYWRVGRTREARYQWERALTLEPAPDEVPEIEAKLEAGLPKRDAG